VANSTQLGPCVLTRLCPFALLIDRTGRALNRPSQCYSTRQEAQKLSLLAVRTPLRGRWVELRRERTRSSEAKYDPVLGIQTCFSPLWCIICAHLLMQQTFPRPTATRQALARKRGGSSCGPPTEDESAVEDEGSSATVKCIVTVKHAVRVTVQCQCALKLACSCLTVVCCSASMFSICMVGHG
jgi:hypothetical protein